MIWFYQKGSEHIELEMKKAPDESAYELVVTRPDGTASVERFDNEHDLLARSRALEQELLGNGWQGPHGRDI